MFNIRETLKRVIVESQEIIYPRDLIEREEKLDLTFAKGKVRKIYAISGLRRIGKTYFLYQTRKKLIEEEKIPEQNTFYINLEDERLPQRTETLTDIIPAINELYSPKGPIYLFIDEIQRIPKWSLWVRRIHDAGKATVFLSGSTSQLSHGNIPRELRGREITYRFLPLSFLDFLKFKQVKIDLEHVEYSDSEKSKMLNMLNEYLTEGGLPEIALLPRDKGRLVIQEYFRTIISRDIVDQFKVENREALEDLLKLLIHSPRFSISKTYNTLKSMGHRIGKETVKKYVQYAENIYFIEQLNIYSPKIKDTLMHPRKIYIADNGFITSLSIQTDKTRLLENLTYTELKRKTINNTDIEIRYWKDQKNYEVDFLIIENNKPKTAIQVAWDITEPDTRKRETRSLNKIAKQLNIKRKIIITYDQEYNDEKNKIKAIPIWKILLNKEKIT